MNPSLPPLIQQMLRSEFYPHPVTEPIQLIQTHISFILLTGPYAYKIKKTVNFGFLDYSRLEKRHHFCLQELQMNQRGAPGIYLEVLPISQLNESTFQLGSSENPVEYTLKMQQFSQDSLFVTLFEQGRLTENLMVSLGQVVAQFHAEAPTNDYIRKFGEVTQIREAINNNYQLSEKYIGGPQTQQQYRETREYTESFFTDKAELFSQRITAHKIRECHGDLHLKNIALFNNKILLFDCIEFNEPFRFVDVMYDVAFTVMDLEAREQKDLGNAFLNTYIEETGDWEGLQVLPLYLSRQAYVRAKVSSLMLDDPAISDSEKNQAFQIAKHYYQLAWQYTQNRQGQLILMSGLSGSGKSTTARTLARHLGAIQIRSDAVRKHLNKIPLHESGPEELYTAAMTQKTYTRLLALGIMLAKQGWSVILDAKYDRKNLREEAINLAQFHQLPLRILHCTAPLELLRSRLEHRKGDIADATVELLEVQCSQVEPFTEDENAYVIPIDTTQELEVQLSQIFG